MRRETIVKNAIISALFVKVMVLATPTAAGDSEIIVESEDSKPIVYQFLDIKEPNPLEDLIEAIGELESDNTYYVVNRYGMLGKYQFSPTTIQYLGFDVTDEEFLQDPELQDSVMESYLMDNYNTLHEYIHRYDGQIYKGVPINTATVLAGAHFAGAGGMKQFFENPIDSVGVIDGNGMTLANYMKKFADYNVVEVQCL